ncbi:MAG: hypothetical protein U9N30_03195 [Campylobacterota bacterium]|nr:hypothetical protein [Campylobacterota bacterium]
MKIVLSILYAPLIYFGFKNFDLHLNEVLLLKAFPLMMALLVAGMILLSYVQKKSIIVYFAKKFSKKQITAKEEEYIHHSTLFWFMTALVNVLIHLFVLFHKSEELWVAYSSIGWYFVFGLAGLAQFIHQKFVFKKGMKL